MRKVIVTGGSRGLGLAIGRKLAAQGYDVVAVARSDSPALSEAIEAARAGPGALRFLPCDLSRIETLPELVRQARDDGAVWGLVNNAGTSVEGLLANTHPSQIEALVRLNVTSPLALTRAVVRTMLSRGEGRIVNMASVVASTGYSGLSAYGATKAAMVGFTKSLAREVGPLGVTVNAVAPGFIDTELTASLGEAGREQIVRRSALRRLAEPDDVAEAVAYLLSDAARNVTGTVLTVDAGGTA